MTPKKFAEWASLPYSVDAQEIAYREAMGRDFIPSPKPEIAEQFDYNPRKRKKKSAEELAK